MFDQGSPDPGDNPIVLRAATFPFWFFVILAALFAIALARGAPDAATTAGRIGTIFFMGAPLCLCVWAAIFMAMHRPTMSISASAITYARAASARTRAAGGQTLVLDRSLGNDLRLVTLTRRGAKQAPRLTIHGSGTTLPLITFGVSRVRSACIAKGWEFPA
jgi:hypothetical protein